MSEEGDSEFGKGYCYCLGLFLAHADRIRQDLKDYERIGRKEEAYAMWFYSAADHMFEFLPEYAAKGLRKRSEKFRDRVLELRLPMDEGLAATESDYMWAVQEAKDLLRLTDRSYGVPTEKGQWE